MKIKTTLHFNGDIKFNATVEHIDLKSAESEEEIISLVKGMLLGFRKNGTVHLDTGNGKYTQKYDELKKIEIDIIK